MVSDVDVDAVGRVVRDFGVDTAEPEKIHAQECDIFAPCAMGAVIRDDTIPDLKCRVVAGSANNQLERREHGEALAEAGILYAPDYVINSGGLINVADELQGYNPERAKSRIQSVSGVACARQRSYFIDESLALGMGYPPTAAACASVVRPSGPPRG